MYSSRVADKNIIFADKKDVIVFFVGCFSMVYIDFIGRIYLGELIIYFLYIIYPQTRKNISRPVKKMIRLMVLWLITALVTDYYRDIPLIDAIKGGTSVVFLILLVPFAYWALNDKLSRWFVFYLGSVVSSQLSHYLIFSKTEFGSTQVWQVYANISLLVGVAVYLYWKGRHTLSYIFLIATGFYGLFGSSRNAFVICVISVVLLYNFDKVLKKAAVKDSTNNIQLGIKIYQNRLFRQFIAMFIGVMIISFTYDFFASNGILGDGALQKYERQKDADAGIASGRIGTFMDIDLISKSPIIGYGSYAKDYHGYVEKYYIEHNISYHPSQFDIDVDSVGNMLPRHSRMFGLWMWHGIGAGFFWIFIFLLFFRSLKNGCFLLEPKLLCLTIYTLMIEFWNNLFSPMADRISPVFFWVFLILINEQLKQLYANQNRKSVPVHSHS